MPKQAQFAYTRQTNKLESILREAKGKEFPRKIDRTWLRSGYQINSNYDTIPSVLKFVKLLNADNTPTNAWELIRRPSPENRIRFARLIKEAYVELFRDHPDAHRLSNERLQQIFNGHEIGAPITVQSVVRTFKTLVIFGDFDTDLDTITTLPEVIRTIQQLDETIHAWRKSHELLESRVESLNILRDSLKQLSLPANELEPIADAIAAAESELFHASHVLAWIGFTEFFYKPFSVDSLGIQDPNFQPKTLEELRRGSDHNLIEVGKRLGFYSEGTKKTLHGMLNDRNRCAHGGEFKPRLNETITFMKKIFDMIQFLRSNHGNIWS